MKTKLTKNIRSARACLLVLAVFSSSLPSLSTSQEIDFQKNIDSTSEALIALDVMASDCLAALDSATDSKVLCDEFIAGVDGDLMSGYLEQCRTLKQWRDIYVDQTVSTELDPDTENNEEMLRRLIAIEFTCGENTLRNRTQFVFTAFNRLSSGANASSLSSQLSESRFNALDNNERQRLRDALQNQQNRSQRESERQFNNLENELIRQQIQRPSLPN